jgi:hypothetical protein
MACSSLFMTLRVGSFESASPSEFWMRDDKQLEVNHLLSFVVNFP